MKVCSAARKPNCASTQNAKDPHRIGFHPNRRASKINIGRHRQKNNVQRQNIEQRRAVNQQCRFRDGLLGTRREIEVEQIMKSRAVAPRCNRHSHQKRKSQQERVIDVQAERSAPHSSRHRTIAVVLGQAEIDAAGKQRRKKNESFGRGDETKGLVYVSARGGGQVRERDPDEHQPAHCVQFQPAPRRSTHL